ncbi:MAG TPA: NADH-quinone oxidoreductase subunit F, partial [Candidatus Marinimicrobia bacterium]|nr:NADH-quinone oxidoreductase subunit F [Candidatus Neomarinimicrobiota bacterium]
MKSFKPILTEHIHQKDCHTLSFYKSVGGYRALEKVLKMNPENVIQEVKESDLRGRGGAGFSTGVKWGFIPKDTNKPTYLINNADESEPGTFKDRLLMDKAPHQMLEGMIISSYAIGCHKSFIYIRGEFYKEYKMLEKAIAEAVGNNILGKNILGSNYDLDVVIHRGAGAYICGEETGLIESLEGKRGWPRTKPPFPAIEGYLQCPTIVNNVETLSCIPHIMNYGADWFKSIGPEKGPGPRLFCISGCVNNPGVYEEPMGVSLKELIFERAG